MDVRLQDISLDRSNPRFSFLNNYVTEEEILEYMFNYENLKDLVRKILENNYIFIGERPIVLYENDEYIVLEGNRRLCALKCIMGVFDNTILPEDINKFLDKIKEHANYELVCDTISVLDVDIVHSRDEAQAALAMRHIDGISQWKKDAKLAFYGKHFETKTVDEILVYTTETKAIVKKMLKEYVWINEWRKILNKEELYNVSYITERLQNFLRIDLKYITDIDVEDTLQNSKIIINEKLSYDDFKEIIKKIYYYIERRELDSRRAGTKSELYDFFRNNNLIIDIDDENNPSEEPILKKNNFFIDELPSLKLENIFEKLKDEENFEFIDSNKNIVEGINNFGIGENIIKLNEIKYQINVYELINPSIGLLKSDVVVNTPIYISEMFIFTDHHGEKLNYNDDFIVIKSDNEDVEITETSLTFLSANNIDIYVEFKYSKDKEPLIMPFCIEVKKHNTSKRETNNNMFNSSYFPNLSANSVITEFGNQMNNSLSNNDYILIMCSLRTFLEIRLHDFYKEAKSYKGSIVDTNDVFKLEKFFNEFISFIANDGNSRNSIKNFYTEFAKQQDVSYKLIKNYMDAYTFADYVGMLNQFHTLTHTGTTLLDPSGNFSERITRDLLNKIKIINEFILFYENATIKF